MAEPCLKIGWSGRHNVLTYEPCRWFLQGFDTCIGGAEMPLSGLAGVRA
jgi:hypothetical protein